MAQSEVTTGKISNVGGEVIVAGGDVTQNITNIHQRALSAIEEADLARSIENRLLAEGIKTYSTRLQGHADASQNSATPYRGLLPYRIADCETFFGRSQAITSLLKTMDRGNLTILHAESGAGKTSLLEAGIAPRILVQQHLPILLRPYEVSPAQALKDLFLSDPSQAPILAAAPLREILFKIIQILGGNIHLFIIVDQFEEFFENVSEENRKEFIKELGKCLDDASLGVHWLFSLRGEAFTKLSDFRPRIRNPFENDFNLKKLNRAEASEIIGHPAKKFHLSFEDGLIDLLLDDLGKDEIAPPQLQLVCSALVKSLPEGQTVFTKAAYQQAGAVAGILRGHLSRVIEQYPPAERAIVRKVLEALISSVPKRVLRPYSDLRDYLEKHGIARQELDVILLKLTEDRLLRVDETDAGLTYELAHDYLLEEIRIDPEVKQRKQTEELLEQAFQNWRSNGILTGKDTLNIIEGQLAGLILDQERVRFLFYSAAQVKDGKQLKVWKQLAQPETKAKIFADRQKNIISRDRDKRQMAEKILTPFWKELFFPVGLYLITKRMLIENRTKLLALVVGVIVLAAMLLLSISTDNQIKWDEWKSIANYREQCAGSAASPVGILSSDFIGSKNIAFWNGAQKLICVTTDNGATWFDLEISDQARTIQKIQIVDNFLFVLSDSELVYTSITAKDILWTNVELPGDTPVEILFAVHPKNPGELWLTTGDGFLYHSTNWGGDWGKISKIPTTNSITALGTNGTSTVVAAEQELWLQKGKSGAFSPVEVAIPLAGEIKSIAPYSSNLYYALVDQQGVFVLNVSGMFMGQGENWKNLDIDALSVSNANVMISNRDGVQCLKHIIPFQFFRLAKWSIATTPYCP